MDPLHTVFVNLDRWRRFPAYQLERRVDPIISDRHRLRMNDGFDAAGVLFVGERLEGGVDVFQGEVMRDKGLQVHLAAGDQAQDVVELGVFRPHQLPVIVRSGYMTLHRKSTGAGVKGAASRSWTGTCR